MTCGMQMLRRMLANQNYPYIRMSDFRKWKH